jgi:hypothetical protein
MHVVYPTGKPYNSSHFDGFRACLVVRQRVEPLGAVRSGDQVEHSIVATRIGRRAVKV